MAVSLDLKDFTPTRLVCLAATLKEKFKDRQNILVLMFSSREAAKGYDGLPVGDRVESPFQTEPKRGNWSSQVAQLHGEYSYDSRSAREYVDMRPFGAELPQATDTRISLPTQRAPECRLAIRYRCLLHAEVPSYPPVAYTAKLSGTVTVTATISRNGTIANARVVEGVTRDADSLAVDALKNLRTWRFEAASREDTVRTTFSYVIDTTSGEHGRIGVSIEFPNQITLTASPPN